MPRTRVHLIAFTLVAALSVCMVTSVSANAGQQPENNATKNGVTPSNNSSNTTSLISGPGHVNGTEDHTDSETASTSTPTHESTLTTTTSRDTSPPHTTGTPSEDHSTDAHNEPSDTQTEGTTIKTTTGSTTKETTSKTAITAGSNGGGKVAGIFFLILILIIIISLAAILYILWKKGKRYSFDLTNGEHETPLRSIDYAGTFEPTKGSNMNLDYIQEDNPDKSNPVANGCSGENPDQAPCSEQQNAPEEDSFSSDLSLNSPVRRVEFNLDLELIGGESDLPKEATEEPTDNDNENNNNETNTGNDSADFFTEINLDDAQ